MNTSTVTITHTPLNFVQCLKLDPIRESVVWLSNAQDRFITYQDPKSNEIGQWISRVREDATQNRNETSDKIVGIVEKRLIELSNILRQIDGSLLEDPVNSRPVMSRWFYELYQNQFHNNSPFYTGQEPQPHLFAHAMKTWMVQFIQKTSLVPEILATNPGRNLLTMLDANDQDPNQTFKRADYLHALAQPALAYARDSQAICQIDQMDRLEKYYLQKMEQRLGPVQNEIEALKDRYAQVDQLREQMLTEFQERIERDLQRKDLQIASQNRLIENMSESYMNDLSLISQGVTEMDDAHQRVNQAKDLENAAIRRAAEQMKSDLDYQMAEQERANRRTIELQQLSYDSQIASLQLENERNQQGLEWERQYSERIGHQLNQLSHEANKLREETGYLKGVVNHLQDEVNNLDSGSSCIIS